MIGCNKGYIITSSKYQIGAIAAAELTNIELITWNEFLNLFFDSWYDKYFYKTLNETLLFDFEYFIVSWFDDLSIEDRGQYKILKNQLNEIERVKQYFPMPFLKEFDKEKFKIPKLPLKENLFKEEDFLYGLKIPKTVIEECDFDIFLNLFTDYSLDVIKKFKELDCKYST